MSAGIPSRHDTRATLEVVTLVTAAVLVAGYTAMRYGGLWGEADTSVFTRAIRDVLEYSNLTPPRAYANGYGFPALAAFLVHASGMTVANLQIFGSSLLMIWIVFPAWLAYRELTGSARGATLATVLLLTQPEFLFPILRGSHEKFTRGLMLLALYLLVHSLLSRRQWRRLGAYILAFYLVIYTLITFNNLFAISFIAALGLALVFNLAVRRLTGLETGETSAIRRRLFYAVAISLVLAFFFTFYAYAPARHGILIVDSIIDRVAILFLGVEDVAINPYLTVTTAWVSARFYLLVSIANWVLLISSLIIWLWQTVRWWRDRAWPEEPNALLLWSFYGAFGFMGAASIIVDVSGAIASNLQHRVFPSFAMMAAPLIADWLIRWRAGRPEAVAWNGARKAIYTVSVLAIAFLGIIAVIKATNEPAVSNNWIYYRPDEFTGLEWSRQFNPDSVIGAGFDWRLIPAVGICCEWYDGVGTYYSTSVRRTYLVSDTERALGERLHAALPISGDSLQIYDNGATEIFRLRPRTPFQK